MTEYAKLSVIILAAGQGVRMCSSLPKVLHPLGGRPLLAHVVAAVRNLKALKILVVYGHGGETVPETIGSGENITWIEQVQQLGTGHAVAQAMPEVSDADTVLVLYGDVPLINTETLAELISLGEDNLGLLTVHLDDPTGYGRIIRDSQGNVQRIVEEKEANETQRKINEINTGVLAVNAGRMRGWLNKLDNNNVQGEFYLTDIIAQAVADKLAIKTIHPVCEEEVLGVNDRAQLAELESYYQYKQAQALMAQGVTIIDPARIDIRGDVNVAKDVTIDINVILNGKVTIAEGVYIGPNCVITDSVLDQGVQVQAMSVIEQAHVGENSRIGPFARLRPGTELAAETHIGNFVEIKNSQVGQGSKINHLSYVGDSDVGSGVNIGAGTITCNYDGAYKHKTVIEDDVFIGSDTQLVAPVTVGAGATIGAGTTITRDVPPGELTLSRSPQKTIEGWKRPVKEKK